MASHLSRDQLLKFRDRELPPEELIAAGGHLGGCETCRRELSEMASGESLIAAVRAAGREHLSYEQMDAWVEETLDSTEREIVMAHIGLCEACARQLQAYESYASAMAAAIPPPAQESTGWRDRVRALLQTPRFAMIATAALVLLVLSPLVIHKAEAPGDRQDLASLRPPALGDLPANPDTTLLYPVSEAVEERQPILKWRSEGNETAEIILLDAARREVAHSGPISGTDWLVPVPLERGAVYSWEVRTPASGAMVRQASFRVLSEADQQKLAAARTAGSPPMAIGEIARDMGALAEAQRQFAEALRKNPADQAAASRLREVQRMRGR